MVTKIPSTTANITAPSLVSIVGCLLSFCASASALPSCFGYKVSINCSIYDMLVE